MGWDSKHEVTWSKLHRAMTGRVVDPLAEADGGDGPAWSRRRPPPEVAPVQRPADAIPYAELHCHSYHSFLDGASSGPELAAEAVRLGLSALALTDHDGFYGVVPFSVAARKLELPTVFGAELSLSRAGRTGMPDPPGDHLLLLARRQAGYHRLAGTLGAAHLAGSEKGRPVYDIEKLAADLRGQVFALTGCRKGAVPRALVEKGRTAAAKELDKLISLFGRDQVLVELTDHSNPLDQERCRELTELADEHQVQVVATNNVHYHAPGRARLAAVAAAIRARCSLAELDAHRAAAPTAHLRSGAEMAERFAWRPDAVSHTVDIARECAVQLHLIAPGLPPYAVPKGHTEASWLRELTYQGAAERYGPRPAHPAAYQQIDHELNMIEELRFPGYFLIVYDIVQACLKRSIYCQGRGSAANSAVCYALRITNVDAVEHGLLFERFLAPERDGPPDIDVDIESDRREEIIQYVYDKYGRLHTAQVANTISYRPRSAVRDVARAFGYSAEQQNAWSKQLDRSHDITPDAEAGIPKQVVHYASQLLGAPRHMGIHSGGMVICGRPVTEVVPVEWARMENRSVLQWDKDDCAEIGLVKFDLLGLGMLSALHYAFDFLGTELDLGDLKCDDPEVYRMLCRADTVGVFQVESRAQMGTLPRLKPECFYDLVVEVALIRPGPIQGGSVHPFIRRKNGQEEVTYPHPLMRNALQKTLGVPLFQEQMMQLAIDVAKFTAVEADQLRRAMGAKRSGERMAELKDRLFAGMAANGIEPHVAEDIYIKLAAFSNYGFPESHAMSFAYLVYASAWVKRYHPAAFCAALLSAQPMGFYSPQSLADDARRHGVQVLRPDINASGVQASLESDTQTRWASSPGEPPAQWGLGGPVVRLGLDQVRTLSADLAKHIVAARERHGPYADMADLARRTGLTAPQLEALATADSFACFGLDRRAALWAAGAAARESPDRLPGTTLGVRAPALPGMEEVDVLVADVWATGLSPDSHPIRVVRGVLEQQGALRIAQLPELANGVRARVGGLVTHRQRPATAGGITFLNLEDETGMLNVVCSPGLWQRYRQVARTSAALVVRGRLECSSGVVNLVADKLIALPIPTRPSSRDWR